MPNPSSKESAQSIPLQPKSTVYSSIFNDQHMTSSVNTGLAYENIEWECIYIIISL
jgi:hypothetical protein